MLTFLWLAATAGFNIESYEDNAEGLLTTGDDGKDWITTITLDPQIAWTGDKLPTAEEITHLHHEAHEKCYIASTIRSKIVVRQ